MSWEKKQNNNTLYLIIIILLIVIAIWAFFIWKNNQTKNISDTNTNTTNTNNISQNKVKTKTIKDVTVYTDSRCSDCNTSAIIDKLKQLPELKNTNFITKDYTKDPEVKTFLTENNIPVLPLFLFDSNNIDPNLNKYLNKSSNNKYFLVWWSFNPISYDKLEKRKEIPKTLDVFTMWYCPFWEIALKALPEIQKTFKNDNIKINIHYIASKTWSWNTSKDYQSLHGTPEAEEDIRQECIKKYYWFDKLVKYLQVRYKNADNYGRISDKPELSMKNSWIDTTKIIKCTDDWEWSKLLEQDIKLAQDLWINASPTWLANNKYKFGWIKATNIQAQFCKHNPNLKGCKTQIQTNTTWNTQTPSCGK